MAEMLWEGCKFEMHLHQTRFIHVFIGAKANDLHPEKFHNIVYAIGAKCTDIRECRNCINSHLDKEYIILKMAASNQPLTYLS